jgi:ParB family chromosome partitioning protein
MGRGLNALFNMQSAMEGGVRELPLELLQANPAQPRVDFNEATLDELAESIRANGIIQPVVARPMGERYQLVTGERRLRAAKRAGLTRIPVVVRHDLSDQDVLLLGLIENLQRENLNPVEEARSVAVLAEAGLTHEEIARRLGKSRTHVTNTLRLLKLPDEVLGWMRGGKISAGHGRALLGLDLAAQMVELAAAAVDEGLSVRRVEEMVRQYSKRRDSRGKPKARALPTLRPDAAEALGERLESRVRIRASKGGGGIMRIPFQDAAHLDRILASLGVRS